MKTVVIASRNPVKALAVQQGFQRVFPSEQFNFRPMETFSGVKDQPDSDQETLMGAYQRAHEAARQAPQADFWVGIEGGIEDRPDGMAAFAWVVSLQGELVGKGRTGTFFLPAPVVNLIRQGKELGEADDIVFNRTNSKQENGAIGILTRDIIDRVSLYEQAVILSLVPFINRELY